MYNDNPSSLKQRSNGKGFESLPRDTIQKIKHSDALAIWSLLKSMPSSWVIRKKWLRAELKLGEIRYRKAVDRLRELGLWVTIRIRNERGHILGSSIQIFDEINVLENPHSGNTQGLDRLVAKGNVDTYKMNTTKDPEKKKKKNRPAEGGNPMGSDFRKSPLTFSSEFGVCLPESLTKIVDETRIVAICKSNKLDTGVCQSSCRLHVLRSCETRL